MIALSIMGNKGRKHSKEEMQEMAIKAAKGLIRDAGIQNCSARKTADRMEYTAGTLYNIFKNFNELITHVNVSIYDDFIRFIRSHMKQINAGKNCTESIKLFAALYIVFIEKNANLWESITGYTPTEDNPPEFYTNKIYEIIDIIADILTQKLSIDKGRAKKSALVIWMGLNGITGFTKQNGIDKNIKTHILIENFIENYIEGIHIHHASNNNIS